MFDYVYRRKFLFRERSVQNQLQLSFTRKYDAPPQLVFNAWTERDQIQSWHSFGADYHSEFRLWDAIPGGRLHVIARCGRTGQRQSIVGRFLTVLRPRLLEYEWGDGIVRAEFEKFESGTTVHVTYKGSKAWETVRGNSSVPLSESEPGLLRHAEYVPFIT